MSSPGYPAPVPAPAPTPLPSPSIPLPTATSPGMVFGVDGTGLWRDSDYKVAMAGSFVNMLCNHGGKYWRGSDAIDTHFSAPTPNAVATEIMRQMRNSPNSLKVYLTGYSRGGAAVIDAASVLKSFNIPVEAMFLFDSVARSLTLSGTAIPCNVLKCYHALRSPLSGSRPSFGNCGKVAENAASYDSMEFLTTHGGMGGVLWGTAGLVKPAPPRPKVSDFVRIKYGSPPPTPEDRVRDDPSLADKIYEGFPDDFTNITVDQERNGMRQVQAWMSLRLSRHGLTF
jgi:hypothetical protein